MNVNSDYAQYQDYGKHLVAMMDNKSLEVAACTEELITDLFTDVKSPKVPIEELREIVFKPIVIQNCKEDVK